MYWIGSLIVNTLHTTILNSYTRDYVLILEQPCLLVLKTFSSVSLRSHPFLLVQCDKSYQARCSYNLLSIYHSQTCSCYNKDNYPLTSVFDGRNNCSMIPVPAIFSGTYSIWYVPWSAFPNLLVINMIVWIVLQGECNAASSSFYSWFSV